MRFDLILLIFFPLVFGLSLYAAARHFWRLPRLTILDVQKLIRQAKADEFRIVLNAQIDAITRQRFERQSFIESQRARMIEAREYLACMCHDAFIFLALARTELWRETSLMPGMENSQRFIDAARELEMAAIQFRVYTALTLIRIRIRMALQLHRWSPFAPRGISGLGRTCGLSFEPCYVKFKGAVGVLCLEYGQEFYDEIMPML
jgi:hypothetical protein